MKQTEQSRRRILIGALLLGVLTLLLCARLFYIQIICHAELSQAAFAQYETALVGLDDRGQIFDRNLHPLTGGKYRYYYILGKKSEKDRRLEALLAEIEAEKITIRSSKYEVYRTETFDAAVHKKLQEDFGAYAFRDRARYQKTQTACHLIGYLNEDEQRGVSGLELLYEDRLQAKGSRLVLESDAAGTLLRGIAPQKIAVEEESASTNRDAGKDASSNTDADQSFANDASTGVGNLVTTLDIRVQQKCEALLAQLCGADGDTAKADAAACIVSCAKTGEILTLASYPTFAPDQIADYLGADCEDNGCLLNRTLQTSYPPGSIFKLIVAASALENGVCDVSQRFTCQKTAEIEGVPLSCSTAGEDGHGSLNMREAMAVSCNCYFAQLGAAVGYEKILETARTCGFGEKVLKGFPGETAGNVPDAIDCGKWDTGNLSIGQGALLVTPLQVHRMTCILACGGATGSLKLLPTGTTAAGDSNGLRYAATARLNEKAVTGNEDGHGETILSEQTTTRLREMMAEVMKTGTASHIAWEMPVWGKSGTAEASRGGQPVKQCWFTGFCETTSGTRYVITVLAENGSSGSTAALPVFRELTETLNDLQP